MKQTAEQALEDCEERVDALHEYIRAMALIKKTKQLRMLAEDQSTQSRTAHCNILCTLMEDARSYEVEAEELLATLARRWSLSGTKSNLPALF